MWLAVALVPAFGQWLPGLDPAPPEGEARPALPDLERAPVPAEAAAPVIGAMRRIELVAWDPGPMEAIAEGVTAARELVLPEPAALGERLRDWLGRALSEGDLVALADAVLFHYDRHGLPVVNVDLLDEATDRGVLRVLVEPGRFDRVGVAPPRFGGPEAIRRGLRLDRGELVRRGELDRQLWWYGRNLFRRPRLFVSPGSEPASVDALIALEERRPWRVSVGYDNAGTDLVGRDQFSLGAVGMTPGEHVIGWQSLVGVPLSSLQAHALSWEIPFHESWQTLQLDGAYARVRALSLSGGVPVESEGTSWSFSALQRMMLPGPSGWRQRFGYGFEIKATDQFALFGAAPVSLGEVRLVHAKLSYDLRRLWGGDGALALNAAVLASPGGLIAGNDDADFRAYDPRADADYRIGRISGSGWWSPGDDWRIALRGQAQIADSRLLPAEQLAAGGHQTVRGVAEREAFADNGWIASLELYGPELEPVDGLRLRLLGFLDHAWLHDQGASSESLSGAGVGLRLRFTDRLDLRADHGWRLDAGGARTHVGILFSY